MRKLKFLIGIWVMSMVVAGQASNAAATTAKRVGGTLAVRQEAIPEEKQTSPQEISARSMQASIEKQIAAVQPQAGAGAPTDGFFSISWLNPPTVSAPPPNWQCQPVPDADLNALIKGPARKEGVSPELVTSVIRRESAGYPCAVSDKGAIGLMQLMPEVAAELGVDPYDPRQNIEGATKYLKTLISRYKGDLKLALSAYNAGPQRVDETGAMPPIPETMAYVAAILQDLNKSPAEAGQKGAGR
jgi:soluble lytic murein transglycosylase-like protein